MALARPRITEEEFLHLPDNGRKYELVDGELREVPTTIEHDVIGANIVALLVPHARGRGYVTISQAGYRIQSGNIRIPDVAYTRKERFPDGKPPKGFGDFAPDLCIEIISPSEDRLDMTRKLKEYFASGAHLVWHIFPETLSAFVYTSASEYSRLEADDELEAADLLPGFKCKLGELFLME
jgi:Uma2 family endonuclease